MLAGNAGKDRREELVRADQGAAMCGGKRQALLNRWNSAFRER